MDLKAAYAMSERELQDRIQRRCGALGLLVQHSEDPRRDWVSGWPDLCIVGRRMVHAELKKQGEGLSDAQRRVRGKMERAGQEFYTWAPADLLSGEVDRVLLSLCWHPALADVSRETPDFPCSA
jgi:hypothetical protein